MDPDFWAIIHDIGRDRGDIDGVLARIIAPTLVLGIDSDRFFPFVGQQRIARAVPGNIDGDETVTLNSEFGHDAFLIESDFVGHHIRRLLETRV